MLLNQDLIELIMKCEEEDDYPYTFPVVCYIEFLVRTFTSCYINKIWRFEVSTWKCRNFLNCIYKITYRENHIKKDFLSSLFIQLNLSFV